MDSLKLIYITDLHEANKQLRYLFQKTQADIYIVAGDLLYRSFYSYDLIYEYISLQETFYTRDNNTTPFDQAEQILRQDNDPEWSDKAKKYLALYITATKNMKEKYQILEEIFRKYCTAPVYVIPGNYDMDLDLTALQYRNIHKKSIFFHGYRISGFGGADVRTLGIPEKLIVRYQEEDLAKGIPSTAHNFFKKEKSHIIVVHKPVFGYFDKLRTKGNSGSAALIRLLEEQQNQACLVLSGHIHDDRGVKKKHNTVLTNPGNFGRTLQPIGFSDGGFFAEIYLNVTSSRDCEDLCVQKVKRFGLTKGHIELLEEFNFNGFPTSSKISLFEEIKFFFRQFETPDAKKKIMDFIKIARTIQRNGETIAFELLGSVNFGMSDTKSDVDLVMYHMCPPNWQCDMDHCYKHKYYQNLLLHTLLYEISQDHYPMEVIDCINMRQVLQAIDQNDADNEYLIRYAFYRRIGRAINKKFLHFVDRLLQRNTHLYRTISQKIDMLSMDVSNTTMEKKSLTKYRSRLKEMGISLPPAIQEKIFKYLNQL